MTFEQKQSLRRNAKARLADNLPNRDEFSLAIWESLAELPVFQAARKDNAVMVYNDFQHEVRTTCHFARFLGIPKDGSLSTTPSVGVPYCESDDITAYRIYALQELEPGMMAIPEPKREVRQSPDRVISSNELQLVLVPGLAFDPQGNRLGRGKGYYDRFLDKNRRENERDGVFPTIFAAIAFECQIFDQIPVGEHDERVQMIITEKRIILT